MRDGQQPGQGLDEKVRLLSSACHAIGMGVGLVRDRVILQWDERLCEMTGYAAEELVGRNARLLYPSDREYERVGTEKYGLIERTGRGAVETRWRRKDGKLIDVLLSSAPLDPAKPDAGITFTALDITARKAVAKQGTALQDLALGLSERMDLETAFRRIVESAVAVSNMHAGGVFLIPEDGASTLAMSVGLPDELIEYILGTLDGATRREQLREGRFVYPRGTTKEDGEASASLQVAALVPVRHRDELLAVLGLASRPGTPVSESTRTLLATLAMQVGTVIARVRAEAELAASEERYRTFVAQSAEGVWRVELEAPCPIDLPVEEQIPLIARNRIAECNNAMARMYGFELADELVGRSLSDFISEEGAREIISSFIDSGYRITGFETEEADRDGKTRYFLSDTLGIISDGKLVRFWGIQQDITALRRAEQERRDLEARMLQAQKLESLGVLAGGIAHDFNNLLMGVLGNVELALHDQVSGSPPSEPLGDIKLAARRARDLIQQMLAYAGKGRFRNERIEPGSLVEETLHLLKASISKNAELELVLAEDTEPIDADPSQASQVLMNLVTNASDALEGGSGRIRVETGSRHCDRSMLRGTHVDDDLSPGRFSYLSVADTGVGMDAETRARVFDPFYSTKEQGRGLGMAAVLGIVRAHRGAIMVESEPGRGSTITVLFPVATEQAGEPREETGSYQTGQLDGLHILLVDDEQTVRKTVEQLLEFVGASVTTASDGSEALGIFCSNPEQFACIILDQTMPGLTGDQCLAEIRKISRTVPVLISSGYPTDEPSGPTTGFLQKPYTLNELLAQIEKTVR